MSAHVPSMGEGQICPASAHGISVGRIITLLTGFPLYTRLTSFIRKR